jgi:hypothetical protein
MMQALPGATTLKRPAIGSLKIRAALECKDLHKEYSDCKKTAATNWREILGMIAARRLP